MSSGAGVWLPAPLHAVQTAPSTVLGLTQSGGQSTQASGSGQPLLPGHTELDHASSLTRCPTADSACSAASDENDGNPPRESRGKLRMALFSDDASYVNGIQPGRRLLITRVTRLIRCFVQRPPPPRSCRWATRCSYAVSNVRELIDAEKVPDDLADAAVARLRLLKEPRGCRSGPRFGG